MLNQLSSNFFLCVANQIMHPGSLSQFQLDFIDIRRTHGLAFDGLQLVFGNRQRVVRRGSNSGC